MNYKRHIYVPLYFAANGFNVPLMSFARACLIVNHPSLKMLLGPRAQASTKPKS